MGLRGSVMGKGFSYRLKSTSNEEKKGPHSGPFLVWRAMCRMHKCRDKIAGSDFGRRFGGGRKAEDRMSAGCTSAAEAMDGRERPRRDYSKQPRDCFDPAGSRLAPLGSKRSRGLSNLEPSSNSQTPQMIKRP